MLWEGWVSLGEVGACAGRFTETPGFAAWRCENKALESLRCALKTMRGCAM